MHNMSISHPHHQQKDIPKDMAHKYMNYQWMTRHCNRSLVQHYLASSDVTENMDNIRHLKFIIRGLRAHHPLILEAVCTAMS